ITFFLNGGNNQSFPGETDLRIPSPKDVPFDQIPEMSLEKVADEVANSFGKKYDLVVTNFANGDVIGHTASKEAKVRCAEVIDQQLEKVIQAAKANGYIILVTADHGNI